MPYKPSEQEMWRLLKGVLDNGLYLPDLDGVDMVSRTHDDHDGSWEGRLEISILPHSGDMLISTDKHRGSPLRFRSVNGGTQSPRTHMALRLLMWAIILDQSARPEPSH